MNEDTTYERPVRDGLYYLESVIFLVEDHLFKIPKRYFGENSSIFSGAVVLPSNSEDADGSSDEKPIYLPEIKKADFESLLGVMYPIHQPASMGRNEWKSVLKLSTIWRMSDTRNLAVFNLAGNLDFVDEILLGQAYGMPKWLLAGCGALMGREQNISGSEMRRLGVEKSAKVCQLRETRLRASFIPRMNGLCRACNHMQRATKPYNYKNSIRSLFSQELADAESVSNTMVGNAPVQSSRIDNPKVPQNLRPVRNERFYMNNIIFLVEDSLFKVPQACFEHSRIFGTVFTLPPANIMPVDGSDDDHPFKLDGIKKTEFRAFLKVLCPDNIPLQRETVTEEEWTVVLKLSAMWDFFEVHTLAIEELSKVAMNPIPKILFARQYNIPKWLLAGYEDLVKRKEPISLDEVEQLGWDAAIKIYQIREESLTKYLIDCMQVISIEGKDSLGQSVMRERRYIQDDVKDPFDRTHCNGAEGIRRAFAEELKSVEEFDRTYTAPSRLP